MFEFEIGKEVQRLSDALDALTRRLNETNELMALAKDLAELTSRLVDAGVIKVDEEGVISACEVATMN